MVAAVSVVGGFPLGAPPSWGQSEPDEAAAPRATPPPKKVTITPTGFEPLDITVVAGQTVEFTNASGAEQTVDDAGTLFDSGPIPDGGGFSIAFTEPGYNECNSAAQPEWIGSTSVGQLELPGPPDGLVNEHLPDIASPPATDLDEIPDLAAGAATLALRRRRT